MNAGNDWDKVSNLFDTYKDEVWKGAADNIQTLWPEVLKFIKEKFNNSQTNLSALEFGCGTGMFCHELNQLGFKTYGIDISEQMIEIAKQHAQEKIEFYVGDTDKAKEVSSKKPFNLIVCLMVLQFIENEKLKNLAESISAGGYLIFANHNPENLKLRGFTDKFILSSGNITVPIYIKTPEQYDEIFSPLGLKRILTAFPETDETFLKKHDIKRPGNLPKYMLLAYQKI